MALVSQYRGDQTGRAVYGGGPPPPERVPDSVEVHALESLSEQTLTRGEPADFEADVEEMTRTILDLLDAVALLLADGVRVRLLVSGIGPDTSSVADRVRELALGEHVELLGAVPYERAHEVYRRGEVFVSPTYAEGFSNTILEAMASELPVISTDVAGVRDCVRPEDNGVLVAPADPPALAAAIRRVLLDDGLRRRIAQRAYRDVHLHWSWPVVAGQITTIYGGLATEAPEIPDSPIDASCRFRAAPHLL